MIDAAVRDACPTQAPTSPADMPADVPADMSADEPAAAVLHPTFAQWRALARLCRTADAAEPGVGRLLAPQAPQCAQALRRARAAWRQRRGDPMATDRAPPWRALVALAAAAQGLEQRLRARPAGYFTPAGSVIGQGLLLQMPAMKAWLQTAFVHAAAVPPDAPREVAVARAGEAVVTQCLALCGAGDGHARRNQLLQLLADHGHRDPLLRLVRRAGRGWLPKGWAESWEQVTGIGPDKATIDALKAAMAQATPALDRWAQPPTPAAAPPAAPQAVPAAASGVSGRRPASGATGLPVILRARHLPGRVLWGAGAAAVLALATGLALHLRAGNGATDALWVVFHDDGGKTMSIDPESIRRDGRQLTYRVGVVWQRERRSSVAVFTTDCDTRERRLETVQHYSGTRYDTATRYEVRGTPAGAWPATGVDVALLRAACAQP